MIGLEDSQALARDIEVSHAAGARLKPACETAGIDVRTLQRWQADNCLVGGDQRPQAVRPAPRHALSEAERGWAKAPKAVRPPTTHIATAVRQVWCWDITYLPAQVTGR